jgi:hypothetical protein
MKKMLKKLDLFGKPVLLTHKGSEYFTTLKGATTTVLMLTALAYFATITILQVVKGENFSVTNTREFYNKEFNVFNSSFQFAFGF